MPVRLRIGLSRGAELRPYLSTCRGRSRAGLSHAREEPLRLGGTNEPHAVGFHSVALQVREAHVSRKRDEIRLSVGEEAHVSRKRDEVVLSLGEEAHVSRKEWCS